jgi:signal transduction histidine kinase
VKLLNYTTGYFAGILLLIIAIWAGVFYFSQLDEIYDSIDDGLDNQKGLIIQKAKEDSSLLVKSSFDEKDYAIREIPRVDTTASKDIYVDTSMYMQNENDFEPVRLLRTVFNQNGKYYQLSVATSMVEEDDLQKQLLLSIIFLYLGLVIIILLMNNFLLRRIWKPFYALIRQLRKFRIDQPFSLTTQKTRVDEFRQLNETSQQVLRANTDTYMSQKQFIENASHELQTPLAIAINKLESLADQDNLTPEQGAQLSSALHNLERLTRLNKSLLLLSKIENRQFHAVEKIKIDDIVRRILDDFADQLSYSDIKTELIIEDNCVQDMNADLAVVMIMNLMKNAIVNSGKDGYIKIRVSKNFLEVENPGIRSLNTEKLFNRFYKESNGGSTGLGLAIVKSICNFYNFNIQYSFAGTHRFRIRF